MTLPRIALLLVLATAPGMVIAESAADAKAADAKSESKAKAPDVLIRDVADELLGRIEKNKSVYEKDADKLFEMVNKVVLPHFDFDLMARLVLGSKQWKEASEEQQERFKASFKKLLVKTYGNALLQYSDETIEWSEAQFGDRPDRAQVRSTVKAAGSSPVPIVYRLRKLGDAWKVYDVAVDNISLVTNYRGTYASEIRREGLDSLISKLEAQAK